MWVSGSGKRAECVKLSARSQRGAELKVELEAWPLTFQPAIAPYQMHSTPARSITRKNRSPPSLDVLRDENLLRRTPSRGTPQQSPLVSAATVAQPAVAYDVAAAKGNLVRSSAWYPTDYVHRSQGDRLQAWVPHPSAGDPVEAMSTSAVFALFRRVSPVAPFSLVRILSSTLQPRSVPDAGMAEAPLVEVADASRDGGARWLVRAEDLRPCFTGPLALTPVSMAPPADVADLPAIHDAALLWALGSRWAAGLCSTRLGPRAMLCVAPPPPWMSAPAAPRTVRRTRHRLGPQAVAAAAVPPSLRAAAAAAGVPPGPCALAEDALEVHRGARAGGGWDNGR